MEVKAIAIFSMGKTKLILSLFFITTGIEAFHESVKGLVDHAER